MIQMKPKIRLKNIDERRNFFLKEMQQKEFMNRKHKKACTTLYHIQHFLVLASTVTGCISRSAFASLLDIPIGIASSEIGLKICAKTARIKKYQPIIE